MTAGFVLSALMAAEGAIYLHVLSVIPFASASPLMRNSIDSGSRKPALTSFFSTAISSNSTVSRLGSPKPSIGGQLELVLTGFRDFASNEPIVNGLRNNSTNSGNFRLGSKVFKKVVRCHAPIISHALREVQAISNEQSDKVEYMTTCHTRLDLALAPSATLKCSQRLPLPRRVKEPWKFAARYRVSTCTTPARCCAP